MVILVAMVWWFTWFRSRAIVISIYIYNIYGDGGGWWCSCQRLTSSPHGWAPPYQPSSQLFNYSWHQGMPIGLRVYLPADGLWMYISSFQSLSLTTLFSSGSPCEAHPSHYLMATSPINRIRTVPIYVLTSSSSTNRRHVIPCCDIDSHIYNHHCFI